MGHIYDKEAMRHLGNVSFFNDLCRTMKCLPIFLIRFINDCRIMAPYRVNGRRNGNGDGHEDGNGNEHQQVLLVQEHQAPEPVAHADFRVAIQMPAQALTAQVNQ